MNILVLSESPRKGGNTYFMVNGFVNGTSEHPHVEVVSVHDNKVAFDNSCNACLKSEVTYVQIVV